MLPVIDFYGLFLQENPEYRFRYIWPAWGKWRHVIIVQDTFLYCWNTRETPVTLPSSFIHSLSLLFANTYLRMCVMLWSADALCSIAFAVVTEQCLGLHPVPMYQVEPWKIQPVKWEGWPKLSDRPVKLIIYRLHSKPIHSFVPWIIP